VDSRSATCRHEFLALVERKDRFIGGTLSETEMGETATTKIRDIRLDESLGNSWGGGGAIVIDGEDFDCAYAYEVGYVASAARGGLRVGGYMQSCTIYPKDAAL
jgi:hypothetical protein